MPAYRGATWAKWFGGVVLTLLLAATNAVSIDVWDQASPNDDTAVNTRNALIPGDPPQRHDVQAKAGPTADIDFFRLVVVENHSYEVRVTGRQEDCFDFFGDNFQVLQSDAATLITKGTDYPGTGILSSYRASFVAPSNDVVLVRLQGATTCDATSEYSIQYFDTTVLNPGWSRGGGFNTFYSLQNTTNVTLNMTLTMLNLAGTAVATANFMIAPGQLVATNTTALTFTTADSFGTARVTHDGPPGGIICDAAIANFGTSPAAIIPAKCDRGWKGD